MGNKRLPHASLVDVCIDKIASTSERLTSLEGLPEELTFVIFEAVLSRGKLTPRLLEVFLQTEHESVVQRVKALQIEWVPPVLPITRNLWLHERPGFY